tara:strand:- start:763 stop:987 length:225 start_codon:yes stop_codon:yes gene_type:complete
VKQPKKFEKGGLQGLWRPLSKVLDIYKMERDDKYGAALIPKNTGRMVPHWIRSVNVTSERAAREYFDSLVRDAP